MTLLSVHEGRFVALILRLENINCYLKHIRLVTLKAKNHLQLHWIPIHFIGLYCCVSMASVILATNRCLEMIWPSVNERLFAPHLIKYWLIAATFYGLYFIVFTVPIKFCGLYMSWFFSPYAGYTDVYAEMVSWNVDFCNKKEILKVKMPFLREKLGFDLGNVSWSFKIFFPTKQTHCFSFQYHNPMHTFNNTVESGSLFTLYTFFIIVILIRSLGNKQVGSVHSSAKRRSQIRVCF